MQTQREVKRQAGWTGSIFRRSPVSVRALFLLFILVSSAFLLAACGDDPSPTPLPTATTAPEPTATTPPQPTPEPTATTAPQPTPEPTATTAPQPTPEPTATTPPQPTPEPTPLTPTDTPALEDLRLTPTTMGRDVLALFSEAESTCLRTAIGDTAYERMSNEPILAILTAAGEQFVLPIFQCAKPENLVVFGIAFLDLQAGWTSDTRSCMIRVSRESPLAVLTGLGMTPPGQIHETSATRPYALEFYNCMTPVEKVGYLARIQAALDVNTSAAADIIGMIPESEAACIQEALTDEDYAAMLGSTAANAFRISDSVTACVSQESYVPIFVSVIGSQTGGLSDNSQACITEFASGHPRYVALVNPTLLDFSSTSIEDLVEIADNGVKVWECFTDEELLRMQTVYTSALAW